MRFSSLTEKQRKDRKNYTINLTFSAMIDHSRQRTYPHSGNRTSEWMLNVQGSIFQIDEHPHFNRPSQNKVSKYP
ncbi:hypothetical cytosolic protein [Syntrophus aciditrophicus SB]|uniref:Hypothetical cytosolic protein n=1 Tax=Syntrophus aciditrophicus (strain SB) TaxID=56780 RepID=Q2LUY0_SYNAS|nr:hypothetical cytosolic protein [Syntrophus aciditrophicus SB]